MWTPGDKLLLDPQLPQIDLPGPGEGSLTIGFPKRLSTFISFCRVEGPLTSLGRNTALLPLVTFCEASPMGKPAWAGMLFAEQAGGRVN